MSIVGAQGGVETGDDNVVDVLVPPSFLVSCSKDGFRYNDMLDCNFTMRCEVRSGEVRFAARPRND